jgi:hypothetical protein
MKEEREKIIRTKIENEDLSETTQLRGVKQIVWDKLTKEKRFSLGEIAIDPHFEIVLSDCKSIVSMDFVINLPAATFAVIRCANSGLEFWERYITAFAMVVKNYQVPFAMVTNGYEAKIINVLSGETEGETFQDFYDRQEALNILKDFVLAPCPAKRLERAKRIIYAFEDIKCPTFKADK